MPAPSPVYMETVKEKALQVLRAAVTAANQAAGPPLPLKGLNIPEHRFGRSPVEKWPLLEASVGDDDGRGVSKLVPQFDMTADLFLDGLIALGRDDAANLDRKASLLIQAICDTLLESRDFLAMFSYVARIRRTRNDGVASGKGGEYDAIVFTITLTVAFRENYTPPPVAAVDTTIAISADLGPAPDEDDPDKRHLVRQQFQIEGDAP